MADPETSRGGGGGGGGGGAGEFANKLLFFFLKIYQNIEIKYEQLY